MFQAGLITGLVIGAFAGAGVTISAVACIAMTIGVRQHREKEQQ